jgi:Uma2 family endonuclease
MARKVATTQAPTAPEWFFPDGETPTWEVAYLFPPQGRWTEDDFWTLERVRDGMPRIELSQGRLEVLPVPAQTHHLILAFFLQLLHEFTQAHAPGVVLPWGLNVRLKKGNIREPDVVYMKAENARRRHEEYWEGADLVMEVVSPDPRDQERDWETKPREYARAGIPEYWIIDPQQKVIRVLTLRGKAYKVRGDFGPGTRATSVLLPGFAVAVDEALAPPGSEPVE